jgi:hypothetical protein
MYPGAPSEEIRADRQRRVDGFLRGIMESSRKGIDRDSLCARVRGLIASVAGDDAEERGQADVYVGDMMRIIGIDAWTDHR